MILNQIKPEWVLWGLGLAAGVLVLNRLLDGRLLTTTASTVARAPVDVFVGATEGLFGLPDPRTAESKMLCEQARAAGDDWKASFYCPAAVWFGGLFDGK